ncbi:hypothetical protein CBR_g50575 [Chara braunii]|uniref:Reverse transcriptase/retrotransposon-derived protein RNase H-like domain-containing protein n=1 Tax=Chara braunii TaxID=69332 RepID=A0A388M718_CHABU|nr:hypothetical protein CBR_g50575 [Chara braunii]|eukprot:GBG90326.1 hypothetical protein CBR_g50575 [Chara braunii]
MAALMRENKERKELLKQAKLKAIAEEQAAKMKKLEEEMEEKKKGAEVLAAAEAEEERKCREVKGESSGTANEDAAMEKKISEWIVNLSLGEDEEAQFYVPQDERDALASTLATIEDPLERQEAEEEKKLEWKLRMKREKKSRRDEVNRLTAEVAKVLEKLREANFKINPKKCEWAKTQVLYLGHVLDGDGIKPEDSKIAAIRDWPTPRTLTELRSFLGLANYYRKFVRNFSTIVAPLRRLLKKEAIWQWDKDCTSALKKLKLALIEYPVLKVADPSLPFVVTTDASQYGIGAVLQQDDGNGYRPVEFMSARMPSEKVATSTYERELYALRQALEHWKHYLLGRHFKVYSDHETLRWLKTQTKMTPKLTRWAAKIDQYDFELKPVKGKYNVVADALSRRSDYFGAIVHYLDIGKDLQEKIRQAYPQDPIYSDLLKRVEEAPETEPHYRTTEGLLFEKTNVVDRLCIPNSEEIRSLILGECHDREGHFGWQRTLANLMRAYTWLGMKADYIEYLEDEAGAMALQTWLTHLATSHGVDVPDLKDKITWEELTRLWKKRFIVDDAPALAINRLFTMSQGNTATRDWLTEWQKIAAVPNLDLPFTHLRREFYNRSCAALSQALGDREQYATFAEIINKAREIIKTNRSAAHEKSAWQPTYVEKARNGPQQQHFAAVQSDSGDNPAATPASSDGDQVAAVQPRSNNKSCNNGKAKSASQAGNGQPVQVPWVKFGLTEAEYKVRGHYGSCYWCNSTKHKTSLCQDQGKEDVRPHLDSGN